MWSSFGIAATCRLCACGPVRWLPRQAVDRAPRERRMIHPMTGRRSRAACGARRPDRESSGTGLHGERSSEPGRHCGAGPRPGRTPDTANRGIRPAARDRPGWNGGVYEARQRLLNRRVARKILPPGRGLTPKTVARFQREALATARLHHTNIAPVYATGEWAGLAHRPQHPPRTDPVGACARPLPQVGGIELTGRGIPAG